VPDAVLDRDSPAYNKGRVWIDRNKNAATVEAYGQAARQDLRNYLLARAEEVVSGGVVLLYFLGRADGSHPELQWPEEARFGGPSIEVLEETWEELVAEVNSPTSQLIAPIILFAQGLVCMFVGYN
jgi:hypothetical protein